jgi:hypothetical protein
MRGAGSRRGLWILDAASGAATRVTFGSELAGLLEQQALWISSPIWAGDGRGLIFRAGQRVVSRSLVDDDERTLFESDGDPFDWSRDGRFLVLGRPSANGSTDLWVADLRADGEPFPFVESRVNETQAQLSPDGRWIAYTANETGRDEVYVQSFPQPGRKRQVSSNGGAMPRWRADGAELFYLAADQYLTAVPSSTGETPSFGTPARLFRMPVLVQGSESTGLPMSYDVTPDGQRVLVYASPENPEPPMTVVANWPSALER